eukprot:TRINITY_DN39584_c0_g2_i1.p1 TRINITY_DN39584_c0_g2~~TRINITY_DN39584_c0_g2_i1.p1  ORF type:complete len:235 (+),score=41.20 TRINITY_DN39584_c0_g2_i1:168-872(+)
MSATADLMTGRPSSRAATPRLQWRTPRNAAKLALALCAIGDGIPLAAARSSDSALTHLAASVQEGSRTVISRQNTGIWPYPDGMSKLLAKVPADIVDEEVDVAERAAQAKARPAPRDIPDDWPRAQAGKDSFSKASGLMRSEAGSSLEEKAKLESERMPAKSAAAVGQSSGSVAKAAHPHMVMKPGAFSPELELLSSKKRRVVKCSLLMAVLGAFLLGITAFVENTGAQTFGVP